MFKIDCHIIRNQGMKEYDHSLIFALANSLITFSLIVYPILLQNK